MGRVRRALLALPLALFVGCGQPAVNPNEAIGRVALIEPTVAPTATQPATATPTSTARPTATFPPPPTARPAIATVPLHANGRIPEGWRIYVGTSVPLSIAYHGDWGILRQQMSGNYAASFNSPDQQSFLIVGPQDTLAAGLPRLLKQSNDEIAQSLADTSLTDGDGALAAMCDGTADFAGVTRTPIAQSLFITLNYRCRFQGTRSQLQFHMGMVQARAWVVLTIAPAADYADLDTRYFAPMLASLKFD